MAKTPNPDIQQFNVRISSSEMQELRETIATLNAANMEGGVSSLAREGLRFIRAGIQAKGPQFMAEMKLGYGYKVPTLPVYRKIPKS